MYKQVLFFSREIFYENKGSNRTLFFPSLDAVKEAFRNDKMIELPNKKTAIPNGAVLFIPNPKDGVTGWVLLVGVV